jgi:hypothetical protein
MIIVLALGHDHSLERPPVADGSPDATRAAAV